MTGIIENVRPKLWLYAITIISFLFACITFPQGISAPFMFLKNIEPGSIEFINTLGLLEGILVPLIFLTLYICMLAILSMVINIRFRELEILIAITTVIAFLLLGAVGLFNVVFLYYCWETKDFVDKLRESDARTASTVALSMTFIILGLLGGFMASQRELYFEPKSLDFAQGFGKIWLGCSANVKVTDCLEEKGKLTIGYDALSKQCQNIENPEAKATCLQRVDTTLQDATNILKRQFSEIGDIDHTVGEFTTIILAQQLNRWTGLMQVESKFILGLIMFSLISVFGFVLEIFLPPLCGLMMSIFTKYQIVYNYKRPTESSSYVILE